MLWLLDQKQKVPAASAHLCLGFGEGARRLLESLPAKQREAMFLKALEGQNLSHISRQIASHPDLLSTPVRKSLGVVADTLSQGDRTAQAAAETVRKALAG